MKKQYYLLLGVLLSLHLISITDHIPRVVAASYKSSLVSNIDIDTTKFSNFDSKKIPLDTKLISSNNQHSKAYSSTKTKPREKRNQIAKYGDIFFRIFGAVFVTSVTIILLFSSIFSIIQRKRERV